MTRNHARHGLSEFARGEKRPIVRYDEIARDNGDSGRRLVHFDGNGVWDDRFTAARPRPQT